MTRKIFNSIIAVVSAVLLAGLVIIMGAMYSYFGSVQQSQLKSQLDLAATALEMQGKPYLESVPSGSYRLTWVNGDGVVLYDTKVKAETMENHGEREEIKEALAIGVGKSVRYSSTLLTKTEYYAKALEDGSVLRISVDRATVGTLTLGMAPYILLVFFAAMAFSAFLAHRLSKRIVEPLNQLDLEHPLENQAYEELSPLLTRINSQHREIARQLKLLHQQTDEFSQITASMKEGLVLMDSMGNILSVNNTALKLFHADSSCVGQNILTVDRSHNLSLAFSAALSNGHSEIKVQRDGLEYQFDISRIEFEGEVRGAVLLAFDISDEAYAERNRREFTANVSHELKTPLQSIIGSAELIENGLVKSEDLPRFISNIRQEAARLVVLIDDIIRLSQLDESPSLPTEDVELFSLSQEIIDDLRPAAESKSISVELSGDEVSVQGVRRMLYEIIYNLCDNAIKYNRDGGKVALSVSDKGNSAVLCIKDNGIGISLEHQSRIFERFYRVDKSHSRSSGGTGLGLSIVKHAVQYHGGTIEVKSAAEQGTEMIVTIPKRAKPEGI